MKNIRLRQRRTHQDDNLAKLRFEFLSVFELSQILGAVSRLKIKRTKEMPLNFRYLLICIDFPLAPTAHPPKR